MANSSHDYYTFKNLDTDGRLWCTSGDFLTELSPLERFAVLGGRL